MKKKATIRKPKKAYRAWAAVNAKGEPLMVCFHLEGFDYYSADRLRRCKVIVDAR